MKKALIIVLTLVLAAGMLLMAGCKKRGTVLPPDKLMTEAMSQTLDAVEAKLSAEDARRMLKNGLFTFSISLGDPEEDESFAVDVFLKNHKVVLKTDGLGKAIGIDLGAFKDNFPGSIFGTKGDNLLNINAETESKVIEVVEKLVKDLDIDFSEDITKSVKEHATLTSKYSVKTTVGGEEKLVNTLNITMTKTQVEEFAKELVSKTKDNPLISMFGVLPQSENDIDLGDEYADTDELINAVLYTDVITNEILGGELKLLTKDYEGAAEYQTIKLDTYKTDDSIKYVLNADVDDEKHEIKVLIQDNDSLKNFNLSVDGSAVISFNADKIAKKVTAFFGDSSNGFEFDYDVTRDVLGNVTYFSASFDLDKLSGFLSGLESMMPGVMYGSDYYMMEGGTGTAYGDYWDDDWDDDDWDDWDDDDDYGYGLLSGLSGKLTVTYTADGDVPAFSDLLKMSMDDLQELVSNLIPTF